MTAIGSIVRCDRLHGVPFGTVTDVRPQFRRGEGWSDTEYEIDHSTARCKHTTWVDANQVETATLDAVKDWYEERLAKERGRSKRLGQLVGKRVPKFNPAKHLDDMAKHLRDAYRHEDGSITYVCYDPCPGDTESPRTYDGTVTTLVQVNSRCIKVDDDDAGLTEARDRFTEPMMRRYLAMFRPDIVHYEDHWVAGDSYGWGYITRENWEEAMGDHVNTGDVTPEKAFDAEVEVYGLWANGEVYASGHVARRGDDADMVFGHLGYDDSEAIAAYHTDSPILEVLA